jgi:putative ABC transport system permease protein
LPAIPNILGRVIQVNGSNTNIVGVMPQSFAFPPGELDPPEVWLPLQLPPPNPQRRGSHYLNLVGRLKPGVPLSRASEEIARHVQASADRVGIANHPFSV